MTRFVSARGALLTLMCVGMFLVQLDVTVVNVALVSIGDQLHSDTAGLQAIVAGYTVALAAVLLLGGSLTDRFGTRAMVLTGLIAFLITSLFAGAAPNLVVLVIARVLQGVAAAILLPSTLAVVNQTFVDKADKARAIGIWAGVSALALPAGPLLGGILTEQGGWRWIFWINVPIIAIALVGCARLLPRSTGRESAPVNLTNMAALSAALTSLVAAAILTSPPWRIGAAVLAVIAIVFAVRLERTSSNPIVPAPLRTRAEFRTATVVSAVMNLVGIGMVFLLSLYLQTVRDRSPLAAGIEMLPLFVPLAVCAPLTGRLAARVGTYIPIVSGLAIGTAGCIVLSTVTSSSSYLLLAIGMAGLGLGMGLLTPSVVAMAMQSAPPELSGIASGINNTARQAAGAVGVALFGTLVGSGRVPSEFDHGLRLCAIISVVLWLGAIAFATLNRTPTPANTVAA